MEGVSVRHAVYTDAPQIAAVHTDCWRSTYGAIADTEALSVFSRESMTARWKERIGEKKTNIIVAGADMERRIVGYCQSGPTRDRDPRFSSEIYSLSVLKEYRRRGIGRELVKLTASQLNTDGFTSLMTWVPATDPARKFYEAIGGTVLGSRAAAIGNSDIEEISYGWRNLKILL